MEGPRTFFDTAIIDTPYVYIDVWSIVHLASGIVLGYAFIRYMRAVFALAWVVGIILAYEVVELALNGVLFTPEKPVDTIWDMIVGFAGAFTTMRLTWWRKGKHAKKNHHHAT